MMDNKDLQNLQSLIKILMEPLAAEAVKNAAQYTAQHTDAAVCTIDGLNGFKAPACPIPSLTKISETKTFETKNTEQEDPEKANEFRSAAVLLKEISEEALSWQKSLPNNYRPAVMALLNGGMQIQVESLSQISFHGIRVAGTLNGSPCSVLAHQSTIQLLCYGQKITKETPKNPIGFVWGGNKVEV